MLSSRLTRYVALRTRRNWCLACRWPCSAAMVRPPAQAPIRLGSRLPLMLRQALSASSKACT
ncbi:hypothetical protein D3C76_1817130 [compost metagenome]